MPQSFKLRYVNELVGVFVLVGIGFVIAGVVTALRAHGWLMDREQSLQITIDLPEEGSLGLKPGNDVQVLGTVIGSVVSINFNEGTQTMQALVSVRGSLVNYLRDNSVPVIHSSFGLGPSYIEILKNQSFQGRTAYFRNGIQWAARTDRAENPGIEIIKLRMNGQTAFSPAGENRQTHRNQQIFKNGEIILNDFGRHGAIARDRCHVETAAL